MKLRRDKVIVVLENKVYVYNFENLENLDSFVTKPNPKGLSSVSLREDACVLAILDGGEKDGSEGSV